MRKEIRRLYGDVTGRAFWQPIGAFLIEEPATLVSSHASLESDVTLKVTVMQTY